MSTLIKTENGELTHSGSGNALVDANFRLVRGADGTAIFTSLLNSNIPLADIASLLFYTRACREGKGRVKEICSIRV